MELDTPKVYEPIADLDSLKERLQAFLQQYNEATRGGDVDLVFFKVYDTTIDLNVPANPLFLCFWNCQCYIFLGVGVSLGTLIL